MSIETNNSDSIAENQSDDETETLPNPERGCGYLDEGKAYLRSDVSADGTLPAFVEFESPIPFKENRKRSYKKFPGIQFELSVAGAGGLTETVPENEVHRHIERLENDRPIGETAGEMLSFRSNDLLMSVGKTHYDTANEFVAEAKVHGVNKAISVTSGNEPPAVNPGRTRLFLIHPKAVEVTTTEQEEQEVEYAEEVELPTGDTKTVHYTETEMVETEKTAYVPGVFGYTYLTRVVYTEDSDGNIPQYIQDYEATESLDVVETGDPTPFSEQDGFDSDGNRLDDEQETFEVATANAEPIDMEKQYPELKPENRLKALDAPTIDDIEKADLGTLADVTEATGQVEADAPPEGEDALHGDEGGALAVVSINKKMCKIMPSNNVAFDDDMEDGIAATTVLGPYRVTVTEHDHGRIAEVEQTR